MDVLVNGTPVRCGKIVAIGRNYVDHAREMGEAAPREELAKRAPFFFLKPATSLVGTGGVVPLPTSVGEVHHEVEVAVVIGRRGRAIAAADARAHVAGFAVFLDLTARDLQLQAKKAGLPWALAKGMDGFAPCGAFEDRAGFPDLDLELAVNGVVRQRGTTRDMIHGIPALVESVSRHMTLEAGDVLATGTPAGVGPVRVGDVLRARGGDLPILEVRCVASSVP